MHKENKSYAIIQKIKAFSITVVGSGIFAMGSTYFSEQNSYRVPRILIPVFEIFGNVGLAIGMLFLGILLIYYAYNLFKKNNGKPLFFAAILLVAIIAFYSIIFYQKSETTNAISSNTYKNSVRPSINIEGVNTYFDEMERILEKFKKAQTQKNKTLYTEAEIEYDIAIDSSYLEAAKCFKTPSNDSQQFLEYNAKLMNEIQEIRINKNKMK